VRAGVGADLLELVTVEQPADAAGDFAEQLWWQLGLLRGRRRRQVAGVERLAAGHRDE
jgi:hypothetical protein